jgi:hypothetical protein
MGIAHVIDAIDMGGALCEYDKYERMRLGDGGKVRLYSPRH